MQRDPRLLVGTATADDAGVYRLDRDRALVQTVDFFTPVVDDPFVFGQIAATNALSDVYAMGGRPLTALNLMCVPDEILSPAVIAAIMRGGALKVKEAGCALVGGHTIRNPEPVYGLSVTGLVSPRRIMANAHARPGDFLVLTKPLGTGIISTGIKRDITPLGVARKAVSVMTRLNSVGAELGETGLVRAATDVTGFGLLGHLGSMCTASGVGAEVWADRTPVIHRAVFDLIAQDCIPGGSRKNLLEAGAIAEWSREISPAQKSLLADAQTSGGLLLSVAPRKMEKVLQRLREARSPCAAIVGRIVRSSKPRIFVRTAP